MQYQINTIDQLKPILIGFRKSQDLTQQAMADKLGVKQQTYQVLESNPEKVTVDRLFRVLSALGVKFMLEGKEETSSRTNGSSNIKKKLFSTNKKSDSIMKPESREEKW